MSHLFAGTLARWLLVSALLHGLALVWLWQQPPLARRLPALLAREAPVPVRVVSRPAPAPPAPAAMQPPPVAPPAAMQPPPVAPPPAKARPEPVARKVEPAPAPEAKTPAQTVAAAAPSTPAAPAVSAPPAAAPGPSAEDLLARYKALLLERIAARKRYPPLARRRGIEGDVTLRLRIDASGRLTAVETPGRSPLVLARQARSAAENAAPFPPPPGGDFAIDFVLRFDLSE